MLSLRTRDSAALRSAVATPKGEATVEQHTLSSTPLPPRLYRQKRLPRNAKPYLPNGILKTSPGVKLFLWWDANDGRLVAQGGSPAVPPVGTDRKSTRLNPSHA